MQSASVEARLKYGDDTEERVTQSREYGRASWRKEPWDCILKTAQEFSRRSKLVGLDRHSRKYVLGKNACGWSAGCCPGLLSEKR